MDLLHKMSQRSSASSSLPSYVKGQVDEETTKGQTGVDMEGIKGGVKGQVEPERRSLLEDFSDREDRHQQRDKH